MAKITVVGAGYVGLTTAVCFADLGHDVSVVDVDKRKVQQLRRCRIPFREPGVEEAVRRGLGNGRLAFTTSFDEAMAGAEFAFIAVATPEGQHGAADLTALKAAAVSVAKAARGPLVLVNKSTVPIGTADLVGHLIAAERADAAIDVVSNPEFLREGTAIQDFLHPDRVIVGAERPEAGHKVAKLYEPLGAPIVQTTVYNAEMIKYAANAFLATRISFINEIARMAERLGADIKVVSEGIGLDHRIGRHFLDAGIGYGGSCIPKDVGALAAMAAQINYHPELLRAVIAINDDQRALVVTKVRDALGTLKGQVIGLLGLAFKPNTDDLRSAPSLEIARLLRKRGAIVRGYDPAAGDQVRAMRCGIQIKRDPYALARGAHALILVTEWDEFRHLDLERVRKLMARPIFVDGRNLYEPDQMIALGFSYQAMGRSARTQRSSATSKA